jgi:lipoprotein-releasing system permease protein
MTPPAPPFAAWELSLAFRYLRAKRREGGVALISIISFLGVTASVALLISTMAIMNGFRADLLSRILGFDGHIFITGAVIERPEREGLVARLRQLPGVVQVSPFTENQTLIVSGAQMQGVVVRGVTPETLAASRTIAGRDIFAETREEGGHKLTTIPDLSGFGRGDYGGDQILLGRPLAEALGVRAGDPVELISPAGGVTAFGSAPIRKTYVVGGVFSIGYAAYDQAYVFMPLAQAQLFFGKETQWDVVEVKVADPDHLDAIKAEVEKLAGPTALVTDWRDRSRSLFGALQVEHVAMRLILLLIVAIAALNIISGLIMLVKNKSRDIAILRTMGAGRGGVLRIFFVAGSSIGVAGTLAGLVVAVLFCTYVAPIQHALEWLTGTKLFPPDVYQLDHIPARIDWLETGFVVVFGLVCSCLATLIPSWQASRLDPVEALRNE